MLAELFSCYIELAHDPRTQTLLADGGGPPGAGRGAAPLALRVRPVHPTRGAGRLDVPDTHAAGRPWPPGDELGDRAGTRPAAPPSVPADRHRPLLRHLGRTRGFRHASLR